MSAFATTGCFDPYVIMKIYKQIQIVISHFNKWLQSYFIIVQESDHAWLSPLELSQIFYLVSYKNRYMSKHSDDKIYVFDKKVNKMCKTVSSSS